MCDRCGQDCGRDVEPFKFLVEFEKNEMQSEFHGSMKTLGLALGRMWLKDERILDIFKAALHGAKHKPTESYLRGMPAGKFSMSTEGGNGLRLEMGGNPKSVSAALSVFLTSEPEFKELIEETLKIFEGFNKVQDMAKDVAEALSSKLKLENTLRAMKDGKSKEEVTKIFMRDNPRSAFHKIVDSVQGDIDTMLDEILKDENPMDKIIDDFKNNRN